jgi:hypothetical protein
MAPPKSYMIPLQFPAGLYDYAKPPGPFAHWTSGPAYSYEEFARSNPRPKRGERKDRKSRAHRNGAPEYYDVPQNAGPFWPDAYPYGAFGRPAAYGPTAREAAEARAKPNPKTDPAWKEAAERLLAKRTGRSMDDFAYRAYLRAIIQGAMPVTHKDGIPLVGAMEARSDLIDEYGKGPAKPNPRGAGKDYSDVLRKHGRAGFGIPEKAPHAGSFPLYPVKRARYAIAIVAAPAYDGHPEERERILRAAVEAHPELKSMAEHALAKVVSRIGVRAAANGKRRK